MGRLDQLLDDPNHDGCEVVRAVTDPGSPARFEGEIVVGDPD